MPIRNPRNAGCHRRLLLGSVSIAALTAVQPWGAAHANQPAPLTPSWFASAPAAHGGTGPAAAAAAASGLSTQSLQNIQQSLANMQKAAQAISAMQAAQATARAGARAAPSSVPNGLGPGGLAPVPGATANGPLWIGANLPQQTASKGQAQVTVTQTSQQALLNWQSFNVGAKTTLTFDQSAGGPSASSWVAMNRVQDPSARPSQILGKVQAQGKVFVINRNGVIFGGTSQIDVGSLLASTADIDDQSFLKNGIYSVNGKSGYAPSFGATPATQAPVGSAILVQPGAQITTTTPSAVTNGGGYVLLMAQQVSNAGAISTPSGQTELAAGTAFILRPGFGTNGDPVSTTRGNEIAVVQGGSVTNSGLLQASTGDITLAGAQVLQAGVAVATTTVNVRGTVHLLTSTNDPRTSVTLAPGSITTVQPDLQSTDTATDSQRASLIAQSQTLDLARLTANLLDNQVALPDLINQSRIEISTGGTANFQQNSLTMAQGGQIAVSGGQRVQAAQGALLDASGVPNVSLPMSANVLNVNVQGYELRDSPVNRDAGVLLSHNVAVDARYLTQVAPSSTYPQVRDYTQGGLLEVSGYVATQGHTIGEWSATGGSITLAGNEVVAQSKSVFNVAGGSIAYQAGNIPQTWLNGPDGQIFNLSTAPADFVYTGVFSGFTATHPRWNVSQTYQPTLVAPAQLFVPQYTVGRDAGSLTLSTPTPIFNGQIDAGVVTGEHQNAARPASVGDPYTLPQSTVPLPGSLQIGRYNGVGLAGGYPTDVTIGTAPPSIADAIGPTDSVPSAYAGKAQFSAGALDRTGLGGLTITTTGTVSVEAPLTLSSGGQLAINAPVTNIAAPVTARSGSVLVSNLLTPAAGNGTLQVLKSKDGSASITLAQNTTIDTRGLWTNALADPGNIAGEAFVNGGNVGLQSTGSLALLPGSVIDASSGGAVLSAQTTSGGAGGNITLDAGNPQFGGAKSASVQIAGTLRSFGATHGGVLTLNLPTVQIGGSQTGVTPGTVFLSPSFFSQGFSSYSIDGYGGLSVAPGTVLAVTEPTYQFTATSFVTPTGSDPSSAMQLLLLPLYVDDPRKAVLTQRPGASLTLDATSLTPKLLPGNGQVSIGTGAQILVDPGQSVSIAGDGEVVVDGTVRAPGGRISINNTSTDLTSQGVLPTAPLNLSIWIGANANLDVAAVPATALDQYGNPYGIVPAGGSITIGGTAKNPSAALLIIRPGAQLDASGTSATIDLNAGSQPVLTTGPGSVLQASNGGAIQLASTSGIALDGTLKAASGGPGAAGGTLSVALPTPQYTSVFGNKPLKIPDTVRQPRELALSQTQQPSALPADLAPGKPIPAGQFGQAALSVQQITAGGFDNISLLAGDILQFDGNVSLSARGSISLFPGTIGESSTNANVVVAAPYVLVSGLGGGSIYTTLAAPGKAKAWQPRQLIGDSTLTFAGNLIDLQSDIRFGLAAQIPLLTGKSRPILTDEFANVSFQSSGDIRFLTASGLSTAKAGAVDTSIATPGDLSFTAAQLYPITGAVAQVAAGLNFYGSPKGNQYAQSSTISVSGLPGVTPAPPYSAGGSLLLTARTVVQGGIIRAPEGTIQLGTVGSIPFSNLHVPGSSSYTSAIDLLPGSITSVSAHGQLIPYGGTSDGINYYYNGQPLSGVFRPTIALAGQSITVASGATLDLRGGGDLTGGAGEIVARNSTGQPVTDANGNPVLVSEGFVSGRGGSADALVTPALRFQPSSGTVTVPSLATNPVYAILPGAQPGYAPVTSEVLGSGYYGSVPSPGAQITIPVGAPGLPAGTYTLLPSYYALLKGAFRVELNTGPRLTTTASLALTDGSILTNGYLGVANAGVQSATPVAITLSSGSVVRANSQYNEQTYSQYVTATAALFGAPRPPLPLDAKELDLTYPPLPAKNTALDFSGTALFQPATGGNGGIATVQGNTLTKLEIVPSGTQGQPGFVVLDAPDLNAIGASILTIGGTQSITSFVPGQTAAVNPTVTFNANVSAIDMAPGATLSAPSVFLEAFRGKIAVEQGATIDTVGKPAPPFDSSQGYQYASGGYSVVAVSNGFLQFQPFNAAGTDLTGPITIDGGAGLFSAGTLTFQTNKNLTLSSGARYGARYLTLAVADVNIGTDQALASAVVPVGPTLNQATLSALLAGDPTVGTPPLQQLTLTASGSINIYGPVDFNTIDPATGRSSLQLFQLNTPAIYGFGAPDDVATITTGTLIWNGLAARVSPITNLLGSALPAGVIAGGPGTGHGTLNVVADQIVFGYGPSDVPNGNISLNRTMFGFSTVNLDAKSAIVANNQGSLAVYETQSGAGLIGTGGNLNLTTPLVTGAAGAVMSYHAGGALDIQSPNAAVPSGAATPGLGAEIDFSAPFINDTSAIKLPSGKLVMTAGRDIVLGPGALIDLAGQPVVYFDQTRFSPGGSVTITSAAGSVTQASGSLIDVSAISADAGSIAISAAKGNVALAGRILGGTSGTTTTGAVPRPGSFSVTAGSLADFAGLNAILNAGGVSGARSFDIKSGDLTVGNGVTANSVAISVDNGSLTVDGTIDARGAGPGTIRLAAQGDLTLGAGSALLAQGSVLQVDSYGQPIDAANTANVTLATARGTLTLSPGATINLMSPDGVARGKLELDAPRIAPDSAGDIAIAASGPIAIEGAASIAVAGFRTYTPPNGIITQSYLDGVHADSTAFIDAALQNPTLQGKLAGLSAYAGFHLWPGVELDSSAESGGNLAVQGDLDLHGYRYCATVACIGSGAPSEPGVLVLRAASNLNIYGSVTDGFAAPPDATLPNPDDNGWVVFRSAAGTPSEPFGQAILLPNALAVAAGTAFATAAATPLGGPVTLARATIGANQVIPGRITIASPLSDKNPQTQTPGPYILPPGWVTTANIYDKTGKLVLPQGTLITQPTTLSVGWQLAPGTVLPFAVVMRPDLWPADASLSVFADTTVAVQIPHSAVQVVLPQGLLIPSGSTLRLPHFEPSENLRPLVGTTQGLIYALAPMLPPGSLSWSMRFVSGADLSAADTRIVQPAFDLGRGGNLTLADLHYSIRGANVAPAFSVVRTGTGFLDLIAGGNFVEDSLYGIYTAGTQSADVAAAFNLPRGLSNGQTVLGQKSNSPFEALVADYSAYYPVGGGDLLLSAQGGLYGDVLAKATNVVGSPSSPSDSIGNWLWRQGGNEVNQPAAWWINFGTYLSPLDVGGNYTPNSQPVLVGFTGIGTLGGGNVTIVAGGAAGASDARDAQRTESSDALNIAVAATGRASNGTLIETGGGNLTLQVGGALNNISTVLAAGLGGELVDLRGGIKVQAGAIGQVQPLYGTGVAEDPRAIAPLVAETAIETGGLIVAPGDAPSGVANVDIWTRRDLVIGGAADPGRVLAQDAVPFTYSANGQPTNSPGFGVSAFSLWQPQTTIDLFSAGGNVSPSTQAVSGGNNGDANATDGMYVYPPVLRVAAGSGNIYYGAQVSAATSQPSVVLAPSPAGQLEFLAAGSIFGTGNAIDISGAGAGADELPNPFRPVFYVSPQIKTLPASLTNITEPTATHGYQALFSFEPDSATGTLHAGDPQPARIYAVSGDIVDLGFGQVLNFGANSIVTPNIWYIAGKAGRMLAGRDIVAAGTNPTISYIGPFLNQTTQVSSDLLLNNAPTDISAMEAGRDIVYANAQIGGPGELFVQAGRNLYQGAQGILSSNGPVNPVPGQRSNGAGIITIAGAGPTGPDWSGFGQLYFNDANQANPAVLLTDPTNAGKVIQTYGAQLLAWMQQRFGFTGTAADALAAFEALPPEQQAVFVLQMFATELNASGLEFNDPTSSFYKSYVRGKQAIATLFPATTASGQTTNYNGSITLFGGSGINTQLGGSIQILTPGGATTLGIAGQAAPPSTAGVITFGSGDIDIYSLGSVLLGQSRVFTTFGGNILIWSAEGDINAGRGTKTTSVYTPPQIQYDPYGSLTLSPVAPSSGAGIATLNPIAGTPPGNVDLIAPLGTIDAGEAGIRVSGNLNVAALTVVNAANIQVQGSSTGLPVVAVPNVAALAAASSAAGSATQAALKSAAAATQPPATTTMPATIIVEVIGYGGSQ